MLDCYFDNQSEIEQGIAEFLLNDQEPKLSQDDKKNLGETLNCGSFKS